MYQVVFSNGKRWMIACDDMGNTSFTRIENALVLLNEIKNENPTIKARLKSIGGNKCLTI